VSPLVVAFAAFVFAVAAGLAGVLWVAAAPERPEARVRARIGALRRTGAHAPAGSVPLLKEEPLGAASWPQRFLAGSPLLAHLDDLLKRSELHVAAGTIVLASVAIALVTPFLLWALRVPASLAVLGLAACVLPSAAASRAGGVASSSRCRTGSTRSVRASRPASASATPRSSSPRKRPSR
jgi:hypothetical protein